MTSLPGDFETKKAKEACAYRATLLEISKALTTMYPDWQDVKKNPEAKGQLEALNDVRKLVDELLERSNKGYVR